MSETPQNTPQQNQPTQSQTEQTPQSATQFPQGQQNQAAPNQQQSQIQQQHQQQPSPSGQPAQQQQRSSSDIEAENRALRTILGAHVEGLNIDEELEFVGPTGNYRPQAAPAPQQEAPPQQDNRSSRRQSVSNTRAEEPEQVDVAAIDKQFDDFMQNMYGFNFNEGEQDA